MTIKECPIVRVPRELLEFIVANARGVEREQMDKLRAMLSEQQQQQQQQASRCSDCGYLTSQREHLGCLRKALAELDAATGGLPQASAAQSAPAGEREAFEGWYRQHWGYSETAKFRQGGGGQYTSAHIQESWAVWQARASWQRTQAAGVPEGWRRRQCFALAFTRLSVRFLSIAPCSPPPQLSQQHTLTTLRLIALPQP